MRVLLRKDGGKLEGRVKTKEGKESAGFVALIPRNAASEHVYRSTEAGSDGKFRLTNIAPGEYMLIALERNDEDAYFEAQYIRQFDSRTSKMKTYIIAAYTRSHFAHFFISNPTLTLRFLR